MRFLLTASAELPACLDMTKIGMLWTLASLLLAPVGSADWFQFRGPEGQGVSMAKNIPLKWGIERGVAWKKKLPGKGWSSPVIGEGKVVMTVARQEGEEVSLGVVALKVESLSLIHI